MKYSIFLSLAILNFFLFSTNINAQSKSTINEMTRKIEVIDFHSTHRCITCNAIELHTRYTLKQFFAAELKSGKITFQVINIDKEKNYKLAEKFEASGTSLFLNVIANGEERQINLTDFAFMKGRQKDVFMNELRATIEKELKTL
jgi:hypothetical protein